MVDDLFYSILFKTTLKIRWINKENNSAILCINEPLFWNQMQHKTAPSNFNGWSLSYKLYLFMALGEIICSSKNYNQHLLVAY